MRALFLALLLPACGAAVLMAGTAKINATLPIGVPLAGYNHGERRVPNWPLPQEGKYTTFMTPSIGHLDPTYVKVLLLNDNGELTCFTTMDAIGSDSTIREMAMEKARGVGLPIRDEAFLLSASHTHSGPGAVTPNLLWAMAPATDLLVPELQEMIVNSIVAGMLQANASMQPAQLGVGTAQLPNVTTNRRASISPFLQPNSVDTNLGIIRVDDMSGKPIATVWNFAIHGVCFGPSNMYSSADIMGAVARSAETLIGGNILFMNADAGDIDPGPGMCDHTGNQPDFAGGPIIAQAMAKARAAVTPAAQVTIDAVSQRVEFGLTQMNLTLQRVDNCTSGGPLDICTLCRVLHCDANLHLNSAWVEESPTFTAIKFTIAGKTSVVASIPGEGLFNLGEEIRADLTALGFDTALLAGYTNAHMGYFATAPEYDIGGYESELTFWGIGTADKVRASVKAVAQKVAAARSNNN